MAVKRGGLGKGLDSLIAPTANPKIKKHTEEKQDTVKVVEKVVEKNCGEAGGSLCEDQRSGTQQGATQKIL